MPASRLIALSLLLCSCATTSAQGLRVSTVVYDAARLDDRGREVAVSNSFSLFHNGRVYDYVEAAGEVVIFDPIARRFVVMSLERQVYTTIAFAQLNELLAERQPQTEKYLQDLQRLKSPEARTASQMLTFQLKPTFDKTVTTTSGAVLMKAASWKYQVSTREWEDPQQVSRYLDYVDWTARLNCLLNPLNSFPEPRIALNNELRKLENRVPVLINLDQRPLARVVMRAEHKFERNLSDRDRSLINSWNAALKSAEMKELPLRSYQEKVIISAR